MPGDCTKFYRCANGRLYTLECPEDTVFDNKYKVCNYPLMVEDECGSASLSKLIFFCCWLYFEK